MKTHLYNFSNIISIFLLFIFGCTKGQLPTFDITTTKNLLSNNGDSRLDENRLPMPNNAKNTALITKYESPYRDFFDITNPYSSLKRENIVYGADGITNGARGCEVLGGDTVINVKINDNTNTIGPIDASNTGTYAESNYFHMGISIKTVSPSLYVNKVTFAPYTTYVFKSSGSSFNSKYYFNTYYRIGIVNITDSPNTITWVTDNMKLRSCALPNGNTWDKEVKVFFKAPYNTWGYEMKPGKSYEIRFYVSRSNEAPYTTITNNNITTSLPNYFKNGSNYQPATLFYDNSVGEVRLNTIPSTGYSNLNNDRVYYDALTTPAETRFTTLVRRTDNPMVYGSIGPPSLPDKEIPCGTTSIATSDVISSNLYTTIPATTESLIGGSYSTSTSGTTTQINDSQIALRIYDASGTDVTDNPTLNLGTYYAAYIYDEDNTLTGKNFTNKKMASVTYQEFHIIQKSTTWNGSTWSNGTPTINTMVILDGDYDTSSVDKNLEACNLTVNNGKKLNITANYYVKVNNNIVNNNTDTNNFVVQSDGNLIQLLDTGTFSGNKITVKRNVDLNRYDYVLWGSPVIGANVRNFSPGTLDTRFYVYNETNDYYDGLFIKNTYPLEGTLSLTALQDPLTYNFEFGKGYGLRAPNTFPSKGSPKKTFYGTFIGIPNTGGPQYFTIQKSQNKNSTVYSKAIEMGNNLVTNPYPSNIDLDKFYSINSGIIYKQFYFWTNTNYNPPMQGVNYPSNLYATQKTINNYAIYNGSGGLTAPFGFSCTSGTDNTTVKCDPVVSLSNIVKPGQAFIVKSRITAPTGSTPDTSQLLFNNYIRTENNTNSQFYARTSKVQSESVDRFWLTLKTPIDFITPILIAYIEEATNDYELDYDAEPLMEAGDSFYSIIPEHYLSIQGRNGPLDITDKIPLGTVNGIEGNYTIALANKEGVFANGQDIYLTDKLNNTEVNLQEKSYTFNSPSGTFNDRFEISFISNSTLANSNISKKYNFEISPNPAKEILNISLDHSIKEFTFEVTDINGRNVISTKNQKQINTSQLKPGMYFGTLKTEKGKMTKKFIIQ